MSSQIQAAFTRATESVDVDPPVAGEPRRFKGLCVNCDDRFICTFRRPESGVWSCEAYRSHPRYPLQCRRCHRQLFRVVAEQARRVPGP